MEGVSDFDAVSTVDKMKLSLYKQVSDLLNDLGKTNSLLGEVTFSTESKELLSELYWKTLLSYSKDLEAFSTHGKRSTINIEDVKLLFRRNPKLLERINEVEEEIKSLEEAKPEKGNKRKRNQSNEKND